MGTGAARRARGGARGAPRRRIVHLTDGVPLDERYAREAGFSTRDGYREARRREAIHALSLAGVPKARLLGLGCTDQQASFALRTLRADAVVTHAYEGEHPDHDAARFVARAALDRAGRAAPLLEMTGYHADGDGLVVGRFLEQDGIELSLTDSERALRASMIDAHVSQTPVLAPFRAVRDERVRAARPADFSRPPHEGRRAHDYIGGFDSAHAPVSPGTLLVAAAMEDAIDDGARELDFLRGAEPYKYAWGAVDRPVHRRVLSRAG